MNKNTTIFSTAKVSTTNRGGSSARTADFSGTHGSEARLEVLTFLELCALLQKKKSTMYALIAAGQAPRGFHVGRELRFRTSEVRAWIEQQELEEYERRAS